MLAASSITGTDAQAAEAGQTGAYVRFIILMHARTGSTMLTSALNSSPNIVCFRDPLNRVIDGVDFEVDGYDNNSEQDRELRDQDVRRFLQERIFCRHTDEVRAVGLKMPYVHFQMFPGLEEWLAEDKELRVFDLRRRNLLRMLLSMKIAMQTGGWVQDRKRTLASKFKLANVPGAVRHPVRTAYRIRRHLRPETPQWKLRLLQEPPTLSEQECRDFFGETERDIARYLSLFREHPKHTIYYEELVNDRKRTLDQAQSFLGLKPRTLAVTLVKQNPEPLRQLIGNYEELFSAFKNTPYVAFFD